MGDADISSGFIDVAQQTGEQLFTELREVYVSSAGYERLFYGRRYGRLHILKTLKPAYAGNPFYEEALHKEFSIGYRFDEGIHEGTDNSKADDCGISPGRDGEKLRDDSSPGETNPKKNNSVHVFVNDPVKYCTKITLTIGFPGNVSVDEIKDCRYPKQDTPKEKQPLHITDSTGNTKNKGEECNLIWFKPNPDEGIADWINTANQPWTKSGNIHDNLLASDI